MAVGGAFYEWGVGRSLAGFSPKPQNAWPGEQFSSRVAYCVLCSWCREKFGRMGSGGGGCKQISQRFLRLVSPRR